ncbi:MAG: hypothetical protein E7270_10355 [Lachnospiraceae bacterium]|nr:hypothetical protein [Lachnospiraceae bacterium]MBQ4068970.1 hypothetical protein [Lachnospiraceae bacterium]
MAGKRKNNKIVKFKKSRHINVGVIIFGLIFLYIGVNIILYFSNDKVKIYEVVQGTTVSATNHSYTGLIVRDELVGVSPKSGYINYYVKEGTKVSPITSLFSIDENGQVTEMLKESADKESTLSDENLISIKNNITTFVNSYNNMDFSNVYDFKYNMEASLLEYINLNALENVNNTISTEGLQNVFKIYKPKKSGIVEYYTDGMENLKENNISNELFDLDKYKKASNKTNELVEKDSDIYKLITDEEWNIYIPLTSEEATFFTDTDLVKIEFVKDGIECNAEFEIINNKGEIFGKLTLYKYVIRYADCRFIDIQININEVSGLKIPKSSLIEKEFYTVPVDYISKGGNSNAEGFYKKVALEDGTESIEFITPTIYDKDDKFYYLNPDDFEDSTWFVKPDSNDSFALKATAPLKGVFNVNAGYCVFEKINILDESGNYYIIEEGTSNGPAIYDHIVLDSDTVEANQIITQ